MNAKPGLRRRKRQCFEAMIGEWTLRSEWSAEHRLFICKIKQNSDRVASMRVRFGTQKGCDSFGLAANSSGYACDWEFAGWEGQLSIGVRSGGRERSIGCRALWSEHEGGGGAVFDAEFGEDVFDVFIDGSRTRVNQERD